MWQTASPGAGSSADEPGAENRPLGEDGVAETESRKEAAGAEDLPYGVENDAFGSQPPASATGGLSPERQENGPTLPSPENMVREEGFALREWRRENAIRLEEKEKREKEIVKEIIEEADEYKAEYYRKWKLRCENSITSNREKEKLFLMSRDNFHAEAGKNYWKAIAELIPNEVPTIEKKGKKTPVVVVIQGPKPGKPTELSRMRQILVKLKHSPPPHMKPSPNQPSEPGKETKTGAKTPAAHPAKPAAPSPPDATSSVAR
ncbi:PREDICTED: clathrin light chain 2-like [Ipomoea nil]|uniref:clathrin light chain 2-like n=1 Tax=Ipomoea nil TaxID=35883 RepID=UPI0009008DCB|nr:PREDICTED: clathrin light chain 2-like [Ipomoea nil]